MLNLSAQGFHQMLIRTNEGVGDLTSELDTVLSEMRQLSQKKDKLEKSIKAEEKRLETIRKALVLVKGVSSKISQTRNQLLRKMERSGREGITIAESKKLGGEIETFKAELQKTCSHPFVYNEPGYDGDSSHDYENGHPGHRYCVVCGFSEETYESREVGPLGLQREYLFKILVPDDERMIERQPWTSEGRVRVNIWIPLGAALKPFEDSVVKVLNS